MLGLVEQLQLIAPTYFVLGNHEADSPLRDELLAGLEDRGIVVLRDEAVQVGIGGTELTLIGLDDPGVRAAAGLPARDPAALLARLAQSERETAILLAHRPELLGNSIAAVRVNEPRELVLVELHGTE